MTRLKPGDDIVIASHNSGKVAEFQDLVSPFGVAVRIAGELGLAEPEETGDTFAANAILKAAAARDSTNQPALADDSGLAVAALAGAPGIFSARWAGPGKDFDDAMRRVEGGLKGRDDRRAQFVCALAVAWPGGACDVFEGTIDGTLVWPPRGDLGFGYDPIFLPTGHDKTFGEMDAAAKHNISHRAVAFRKLVNALFET